MEVILFLIPIALLFVGLGLWLFFWAVDNGQFDDLDSPAHRILFDEDPVMERKTDKDRSASDKALNTSPEEQTRDA